MTNTATTFLLTATSVVTMDCEVGCEFERPCRSDSYSCACTYTQCSDDDSDSGSDSPHSKRPRIGDADSVTILPFVFQVAGVGSDSPPPPPSESSSSLTLTFRTLAGTHTIDVQLDETHERALARHFNVDVRRIVLQMLDDEACVSVLDPFDVYHDVRSPTYRCPPGFLELYQQNLDKVDWSELSDNAGAHELLIEHLDRVNFDRLSRNPHPDVVAVLSNLYNQHLDLVNWREMSGNASALDFSFGTP